MSLTMKTAFGKAWDFVCDSLAKYPPAPVHGGTIMSYNVPAVKPSEPAKPETVTLANGMVVPAPKEGVNVYDPRKDVYDCAEVSLYEPQEQAKPKYVVPRFNEDEGARWCP